MVLDPEKEDIEAQHVVSHKNRGSSGSQAPDSLSLSKQQESKNGDQVDSESQHSRVSSSAVEQEPAPSVEAAQLQSKSRAVSVRSSTLSIVPRTKRRGLLGRWTVVPEVHRPYDYPNKTKWLIVFVVAIATTSAPLGSAIFFPSLIQVTRDFNTTETITNLSVALYMLSMSIFPLWWSSFSETLGRRTIYLVSFAMFTVFNIIAAESTSIAMLIVTRVLGGGAAASVQAVGAGTIADIWEPRERGKAMGIFYLGPLLGPLLAPIIGGVLAESWGWRSTQWFQVIYGGVLSIFILFCLPETLAIKKEPLPALEQAQGDEKGAAPPALTRISTRQSAKLKTRKAGKVFRRCIIDPLSVLAYLRFPAVLCTVLLASVAFGSLYVLNISIQRTFAAPPYNFKTIIVGVSYIPPSLGYCVASVIGGKWADKIMIREATAAGRYDESGKLIFQPEDRMRENVLIAAIVFPGGLLWYGWTAEKGVFWVVPLIANFFFGVGSMIVFATSATMLTEFMPKRSSSGIAVNNFVRNIFSACGGIVAEPIIASIGNGWLFTILATVGWGTAFTVIVSLRKFGPKWRIQMNKQLA